MKRPWLRWTVFTFGLGLSGFLACSNSGGMAGTSGISGCGADPSAACAGTSKPRWDGHQCVK